MRRSLHPNMSLEVASSSQASSRQPQHQALSDHHDSEDLTPLHQLVEVASIVLDQALTLLDETITSNSHLTFTSRIIPGSTIGKHIRHAHAHFLLLLDCVEGDEPRVLNYDGRKRDTPMETDVAKAKEGLQSLLERLERLKGPSATVGLDDPLTLNAVTPDRQILHTSFGRELWFSALHAVHHWSMVRVIASEQSLEVEESLGVAPSTLMHRGAHTAALGKAKI